MKNFAMPFSKTASRCFTQTFALVLLVGTVARADDTVIVYNSIPNPLPHNVASDGLEATFVRELGDGFMLAGPAGRTLDKVTVILSSWACVSGNWYTANTCHTPPGSTFDQPITVNIYAVTPPTGVGPLLATITHTFELPYRPSTDSVHCTNPLTDDPGHTWYSTQDKTCYHGLAVPITVDFSPRHVTLPGKIIVTAEYNTSNAGPSPLGDTTACRPSVAGCPYDSLNISTDSNGGIYQAIGSVLDPNGIFVNYINPASYCQPHTAPPGLSLDTGANCWTGFHPMIRVSAIKEANEKDEKHGDK